MPRRSSSQLHMLYAAAQQPDPRAKAPAPVAGPRAAGPRPESTATETEPETPAPEGQVNLVDWMINSQCNRLMSDRWGDDWPRSRYLQREARELLNDLQHHPGSSLVERYKNARRFVMPW
jgi:hypothetical protein